jgi:Kef-type K+ transport system membrane component KefB
MEVDPTYMRRRLEASVGIGVASFAGPFGVASLTSYFETQFSLLVTVVVLSAVVPTAVAERWFLPDGERERRIDRDAYAASEELV